MISLLLSPASKGAPKTAQRRQRPWRRFTDLMALSLAITGVAAIAQHTATRLDDYRYPPPGQMVSVGDHRLHLHRMGADQAAPTVILEAGLGGFSSQWGWIQPAVATFAPVVAYDRAGLGWSDANPYSR